MGYQDVHTGIDDATRGVEALIVFGLVFPIVCLVVVVGAVVLVGFLVWALVSWGIELEAELMEPPPRHRA